MLSTVLKVKKNDFLDILPPFLTTFDHLTPRVKLECNQRDNPVTLN